MQNNVNSYFSCGIQPEGLLYDGQHAKLLFWLHSLSDAV